MKFESYWLDTAPVFTRGVADDVLGRVDVAVCSAAARGSRCRTRSPIGNAARFFVLGRLFPELADVGIDYCWGGAVDMSADRLPRAGEQGGLYYSMDYSGHGVQMAVHMGQVMAEVMDGRVDANPWQGLKWLAIPAYFGNPWCLPAVGACYRLQDILD